MSFGIEKLSFTAWISGIYHNTDYLIQYRLLCFLSFFYYDDNRQFAFFANEADADTVEKIVFKCDVKVCANEDKEFCSSSDQCDVDQCRNGQCGNSIGQKRKRHAMTRQNRQSNIEISKEISVPVISPENCEIVAGNVCLEIKNKPIQKDPNGTGNDSVPIHTTKTICVWIVITMLNI